MTSLNFACLATLAQLDNQKGQGRKKGAAWDNWMLLAPSAASYPAVS
jgi:hypothetical protein